MDPDGQGSIRGARDLDRLAASGKMTPEAILAVDGAPRDLPPWARPRPMNQEAT